MRGGKRDSQWNWDIIYPIELSLTAESFMKGILKENPDERASIRMCMNHQFIKKHQNATLTMPHQDLVSLTN